MPKFDYQAIDSKGRLHKGQIEGDTASAVSASLFSKSWQPISVHEHHQKKDISTSAPSRKKRRVRTPDLVLYTKQLITMVRVGIPVSQCLEILQDQAEHPTLREISQKMRTEVQEGNSLSGAMAQHPNLFSSLYITIVSAGEKSGNLPAAMDRLVQLIEHEEKVKSDVRVAFRYPILVVSALVIAFIIMIGFVVPTFATFFERAELQLPLPTRICLGLSEFLTSQGHWILLVLLVAVLFGRSALQNPTTRRSWDRFLLQLPFIGPVLIKAAMTRFASVFAILHSSGLLILESMDILSRTMNNRALSFEFEKLRTALEEGHGLSKPLRSARFFPRLLTNMIAIGEETGRLEEMLVNISQHYDTELQFNLKKMTDAIGPLLIVGLTFIVGFFALAIYLPMWDLTQMAL